MRVLTIQFGLPEARDMPPKFFLCIAVFLTAAQCEASNAHDLKANAIINKFTNWIKSKEIYITRKIENAAKELKTLEENLLNNAQERLHESVTHIEKDLVTWESHLPARCYAPVNDRLQNLKTASASDFFHCSNHTKGVADVGKILSDVADIAVTVLHLCNSILDGVGECTPYVSPKGLKCISNYVIKVIKELKEDVPQFKQYFEEIASTGKDLREQVEACLHPSKTKLEGQLTTLMASLSSCTA